MMPELSALIVGVVVFVSSFLSLELGLSVAIIEILLGAGLGAIGIKAEGWMSYLAGFGGILLTYLAGTEIDLGLLKQKFKPSFLIGFFSFLAPFAAAFAFAFFVGRWTLQASLIAGIALSTTSLAGVYSVLVE